MKHDKHFRKHVKNIQRETKNAGIVTDVAGNPPKQQAKQASEKLFTPIGKGC